VRKGESGVERSVAQREPRVVSRVRKRVARAGEKRAPAKTFFRKKCEHDRRRRKKKTIDTPI